MEMKERPRRLRRTAGLRAMLRETTLSAHQLIQPLFVTHGEDIHRPVPSMPGIFQHSVDQLEIEVQGIVEAGIHAVLLFGIPSKKDEIGSENFSDEGVIQLAIKAIKKVQPELLVITDVCLCEYTSHGHCGLLSPSERTAEREVLNDETLKILDRVAVSHAKAGVDVVAPSGMMDGMVGSIRSALDDQGYSHVSIMSYAVKYASAFYGPFREAVQGGAVFGDRRSHQMDPANSREALREAKLDVAEGADFLMVKPALPYLDVISGLALGFPEMPLVSYQVSGEYSMLKAAIQNGWLDEKDAVMEALIAIRRAGADLIITYYAKDVGRWLS